MIELDDNMWQIQSASDLPDVAPEDLFLDIETENNTENICDSDVGGRYCFKGDKVGGIAFTWDDNPKAFYIPLRHNKGNVAIEPVYDWLRHMLRTTTRWINHHIMFDALFLWVEGVEFQCELVDTLTLSKIHDSDRLRAGLKEVCRDWCEMPMDEEDEVASYLANIKSKNYMDVPTDIMGRYACMDTIGNRKLYEFLVEQRSPDMRRVWETEISLTPVLFDMELRGLRVDPLKCKIEHLKSMKRMIAASTRIQELTEREFTNSSQCVYDILVTQFGLPVLQTIIEKDEDDNYVDTGRATFNKFAMAQYAVHPEVTSDPKVQDVVTAMLLYRQEQQFDSLFATTFLDLHDSNNRIHPHYNQIVRTGRMSCSKPNGQQQNKRSKRLILPDEDHGFVSCDYSQIEFRLICHYIKDHAAITAYSEDPDTDFHSWVAGLLGVNRSAGKTLNFGMAYGAGKAKVASGLVTNPLIIEEIGEVVNKMVEEGKIPALLRTATFEHMCAERAAIVYQSYHDALPGIKATAARAAAAARYKGYVFNWLGRRRYLPTKASRKAFNAVIQGGASDIMKERMVAVSPRNNEKTRALGIDLAWNVHDDVGFHVPRESLRNPEVHDFLCNTMESTIGEFSVPIRTGLGLSDKTWAEAAGDTVFENGTAVAGELR